MSVPDRAYVSNGHGVCQFRTFRSDRVCKYGAWFTESCASSLPQPLPLRAPGTAARSVSTEHRVATYALSVPHHVAAYAASE
eukprot:2722453-Rhodomonas_salina.1